jgi:hypothetical protein
MSVENNGIAELSAAATPLTSGKAQAELIYVGFWRRLAAYALDFAILLPYALLARQLIYTSRSAYLANLIIGTAFVAAAALPGEKSFVMTHREADSRFLTSIERVGPCEVSSDPVSQLRVPSEIYPKESVDRGETGPVQIELTFDSGWCVRKATIVNSAGHWRLDQASLSFLMTVRYKPDPEAIKIKDGESTMVVKLEWRRGVCGGYKKCLYIDLTPSA